MPRTSASRRGARDYSDVPVPNVSRSVFDRSLSTHTAFNAGDLIPVYREELLPGDSISIRPTVFARITTMEVPIFSNVYVDVHFHVVPIRTIWPEQHGEEFFGAEPDGPGTRTDRTTPKLDLTAATGELLAAETLHDYIGIPPGIQPATTDECPHNFYGRAYAKIFNDLYRDAEIEAPIVEYGTNGIDGPDVPSEFVIQKSNKQRDRFTSARPWPYKGPDITIALGTSAPLSGDISSSGEFVLMGDISGVDGHLEPNAATSSTQVNINSSGQGGGSFNTNDDFAYESGLSLANVTADLSNAIGPTVNDLRLNIATQHLFEMFARGGSARYTELNETVFHVKSPDSRLQRAEYIGGTTARMYTNPVTVNTQITRNVGELAAFGVALGRSRNITYSAVEHCVVLGIARVRSEYLYSQGLDKDLSRHTRFDYFWPAFQGLGEQPILNQEINWLGAATDDDVFGYEPRYQEYRERQNMVTGKLRPSHPTTLANWHLGQEFSGVQNLNKAFIQEDPPMDRVTVLAASSEPTFKFDMFAQVRMARPISAQGMPGLPRL